MPLDDGGAEANSFERLMADLAEWFIENRAFDWQQELRLVTKDLQPHSYQF
jgi:hypothetical protein